MKTLLSNLIIILFSILVLACNYNKNNSVIPKNNMEEQDAESGKSASLNSPCELVSLEDVKNMFAIPEVPIKVKDVIYTYPTCVYKWKDGNITSTISFGGQEITAIMPSEVLIVMVKEATENMFKTSTSIYKQPQAISNIGSMAIWDSRMSQLTFLHNNYMFHVHVRVSNKDSENREKATEVSNLIVGKI